MLFAHYSNTKPYRRVKFLLFCIILFIFSALIVSFINSKFKLTSIAFNEIRFVAWHYKPGDTVIWAAQYLPYVLIPIAILLLVVPLYYFFFGGFIGKFIVSIQKLRDSSRFSVGGNARFAGMFEEYLATKEGKTSLLLGRSFFDASWEIKPNDDRHMLTIAGSRTGKGASCIIPNLLTWKGSILCIDPKGTNTHVTAKRRRSLGQKVYVLDPFNETNEPSSKFNPLSILDVNSDTIVEDIALIVDGLITEEPEGKNKHFTESARLLVSGFIAHAISSGKYEKPTLQDVLDMVNLSSDDLAMLCFEMESNTACGGLAKKTAERIVSTVGSNEFSGVLATISTNLKWLSSVAFRDFLSESSFSFEEMKQGGGATIYLVLPPRMLNTHATFLRLFVNIGISTYTQGGKSSIPGLFVIDEAHSLGYMKEIAKAYGLMASYNMFLWTFFQDKGQLTGLYGDESGTFIGSSRAVQVFGIRDKDATWVAELLGSRAMADPNDMENKHRVMNLRDATSVEKDLRGKGNTQYILRSGDTPIICERVNYFEDYRLTNWASADPDHPWPPKANLRNLIRWMSQDKEKGSISLFLIFLACLPFISPFDSESFRYKYPHWNWEPDFSKIDPEKNNTHKLAHLLVVEYNGRIFRDFYEMRQIMIEDGHFDNSLDTTSVIRPMCRPHKDGTEYPASIQNDALQFVCLHSQEFLDQRKLSRSRVFE